MFDLLSTLTPINWLVPLAANIYGERRASIASREEKPCLSYSDNPSEADTIAQKRCRFSSAHFNDSRPRTKESPCDEWTFVEN